MRETVEIRSMTAREEDILTSRALIKKGTVITELIKSCLIDKKIYVPDMLAGDRNAIMVALSACAVADAESQVPSVPACALSQLPRAQVSLSPLPRPPTRTPKHVSVPSPVHGLPSCAAQRKKA